ncbi:MAG: prepilin-type N-terminal cleavage/methylation domain-containing protein [Candidatus Omnitrophica bacterium]|nr:prepilin-type N-terminal cleavage/methylation domain-containing protein [Candidatus Omnitrophota bacterium]
MKKGFTLLELIIVIIIIGVLATLGFTQYAKMIEKGRMGEAKSVLGNIRTMEKAYQLETGNWGTLAQVGLSELPGTCSNTQYYFTYSVNAGNGTATASRCATGGKPAAAGTGKGYDVVINFDAGTLIGGPT